MSRVELTDLRANDVILDCRVGPDVEARFAAGHLRGAQHAHLERDLSAPGDAAMGGRHPLPSPEAWARTVGGWGIGAQDRVVLYDDRGGALAAARAWWMFRASGHDAVILEGGLRGSLETGAGSRREAVGREAVPWALPTVDADGVAAALAAGGRVIDVRAAPRYRGEFEPLDPVAGHIPGAENSPLDSRIVDGRLLGGDALERHLAEVLDGGSAEDLIVHCGSGVTACHLLWALDVAGRGGASLYVGSWSEWCRQERPRSP